MRSINELIYTVMTEQCNANCEYCYFPGLNSNSIIYSDSQILELEKIFKMIDSIGSVVFLGGGEPGCVLKSEIDKIFNILNNCIVATNGLFVKKYYDLFSDKIQKIIYHVLSVDSEIYETPVNDYVYIIHTENIDSVPLILDKFGDNIQLKFYNSREDNIKEDELLLKKEHYVKLLEICYKYNYKQYIIDLIESKININLEDHYEFIDVCRNKILPTHSLHLVRNKIYPCCMSDHLVSDDYPDITFENFINHVYKCFPDAIYKRKILDDIPCEGCNRYITNSSIYKTPDIQIRIKQKVKAIRYLKNYEAE